MKQTIIMKITVIYFSQSGNTRKVARAMAEQLRAAGAEVNDVPLKKASADLAAASDLLGVGAPCFSSRAPQPVLDFIAGLPDLAGKRSFVFATSGGGPGRVLYEMTSALRQKNANVIAGLLLRGECFHPFPAIKGRFPGRPDERDLAEARAFAQALYEHAAASRTGPLPQSRPDALRPGRGFYDLVAATVTDAHLRRALPPPTADPAKCTRCRLCEIECPTRSIVLDPDPAVVGDRCLRCYRCFNVCPEGAIAAEMRLGNLLTHVFYSTVFERYLGDVKAGEKFY